VLNEDNNQKCLYLMSSNASEEYILDTLETLALPPDAVHHFRYQLKWIDKNLKSKLRVKGEIKDSLFEDMQVIVSYLYQNYSKNENDKEKWIWNEIFPLRTGILMDAYKTGNEDDLDVAHFYFKIKNYFYYKNQDFTEIMKQNAKQNFGEDYAFLSFYFYENYVANKKDNKSALYKICQSNIFNKFITAKDKVEYYPLSYFIDNLKDAKGNDIEPKYNLNCNKSFYELKEGDCYYLNLATHYSKELKKFTIELAFDDKIISIPDNKLEIKSPYNEESLMFATSLLEKDVLTFIRIKTKIEKKLKNTHILNLDITLPIKIKKKQLYRVIDTVGEIGFGIGTGLIALSAVLGDKWQISYWKYVIFSYSAWIVCKFIIKLWRG
jgi:hypothetical protein